MTIPILSLLSKVSAQCNHERELQDRVSGLLAAYGIRHHRAAKASNGKGRFDFLLLHENDGTIIETKTRDGRAKVLRQIKGYADAPEVKCIIVMSRQPLSLPATLSGKPIHNVEIWKNFT